MNAQGAVLRPVNNINRPIPMSVPRAFGSKKKSLKKTPKRKTLKRKSPKKSRKKSKKASRRRKYSRY